MSVDPDEIIPQARAYSDAVSKELRSLCEEMRRFLHEADREDILLVREAFLTLNLKDKLVALGPSGSKALPENEYNTAVQGLIRIEESIGETPINPTGAARLRAALSGNLLPAANKAKATAIVLTQEEERFARELEKWLKDLRRALAYAKLDEIHRKITEELEACAAEAADDGQSALGEPPRG